MATLEKIRNRAGLLVGVIGVALLAFIVGDMLNGSQSFIRQSNDKVIEINGEKITTEQFHNGISELTEIYRMQSGQATLSPEYSQQINTQVYDNFVREILFKEEASKIGMSVSSEELVDIVSGDHISPMIMQMPFFINPSTGVFDRQLLMNFLQTVVNGNVVGNPQIEQARQFWLFWEKNIKNQRLEEKFTTLLSKAISPNSLDVQAQYEGGKISADFVYAKQALTTIPDSLVTVSPQELKARYEELKDARYKQEEMRQVKYFYVDIDPSEADFSDAEKTMNEERADFASTTEIASFVNLNSDVPYVDAYVPVANFTAQEQEYIQSSTPNEVFGPYLEGSTYKMYRVVSTTTAPDSVTARQIVLSIDDRARALELADSLMNVLQKGGDFEALAKEFSIDPNAATNGGLVGTFTQVDAVRGLGQEFANVAFEIAPKKFFTLETPYGVHIAQVTKTTKPVKKAKVAQYAVEVTASSRTFQQLYSQVSSFVATNNTLEKIEANASSNGYNLLTNTRLASTDYTLGAIQDARAAVRGAFHSEVGSVSEIYEIDNKFVVLMVTGKTEKGYTPLAHVESMLAYEIRNEKKADQIAAELEKKGLSSVDAYASAMESKVDTANFVSFNTRRITGLGDEPVIVGAAPYVAEGKVVGPLKGKTGVYVLSVFNKTESEAPFNAEEERKSLIQSWNYRLMYQAYNVLQRNAEIEDYRINFY